jgi:hypothetical protein
MCETKYYNVFDAITADYALEPMVCLFCGGHEVDFNQYIHDAYCSDCGTWQVEEFNKRKKNEPTEVKITFSFRLVEEYDAVKKAISAMLNLVEDGWSMEFSHEDKWGKHA